MPVNTSMIGESIANRDKKSEFWKPTSEKHIIRLLPPKNPKLELPWVHNAIHFGLPLESGPLCCSRKYNPSSGKLYGEGKCPICEVVSKFYKSDSEEDRALAKKYKANHYFYANIIDLSDNTLKPTARKPVVYRFGKQVKEAFENAFRIFKDKSGKLLTKEDRDMMDPSEIEVCFIDITDLKKGYPVGLKKGSKTFTGADGKAATIPDYILVRLKDPKELLDAARIMKESKDITSYLMKADMVALERNAKALLGQSVAEEDIQSPPEDSENIEINSEEVEEYTGSDNTVEDVLSQDID